MPEITFCDNKECIFEVDEKCINDCVIFERANDTEKELMLCQSFQAWE